MANGFIIAAPNSGSGKTIVTTGLLRALTRRGVRIAPAKIGPDYIDPQFHEFAAGRASFNLDGWAMRGELIHSLAQKMAREAELIVVEGVMGLFDGAVRPGQFGHGATADVARLLDLPVILVIDCARMGQSVAAMVQGFAGFDKSINVAGVILNKLGSERHVAMMKNALNGIGIEVVGAVPRSDVMQLSARHLGLVQASEIRGFEAQIDKIASHIEAHIDLERLSALASVVNATADDTISRQKPFLPGSHLAVARDDAFRFFYPHQELVAEEAGQTISYFSPLNDDAPATDADAIFLPGGYPELHAKTIGAADTFKRSLNEAAEAGKTIYGECGGYMVLGEQLIDKEGMAHEMVGLLNLITSFENPKLSLGYRFVERCDVNTECPPRYRCHEFHYARIEKEAGVPLFRDLDAGCAQSYGLSAGSVSGSFMHIVDQAGGIDN